MYHREGEPDGGRPGAGVPVVLIAAGWLAVGLLFAAHEYLSGGADGHPTSVGQALYWSLSEWGAWAVLTPVIVLAARRFPVGPPRLLRGLGFHGLFGIGFGLVQVVAQVALDRVVVFATGDPQVSIVTWLSGLVADAPATLGYLLPRKLGFNVFIYWVVLAVGHVWGYQRLAEARAAEAARLNAELAEARLHALTAQLKPHFLFNTLNAITELVHEDPRRAERMLEDLGDLLRRAIGTEALRAIPLSREMEYVSRYLAIQQTRFGDRLQVSLAIDPGAGAGLVPPEVLQPAVENAVEHGMPVAPGVARIEIAAHRRQDRLCVTVRDHGPGPSEPVVSGTGLRGSRARLEMLFGDDVRLDVGRHPAGGAVTTLEVPWLT